MLNALPQWLKRPLDASLGFFYPEVCQICESARATADEGYVCETCRQGIRYVEPPWCECCGRPFEGEISGPFFCSDCLETRMYFSSARSVACFEGVTREIVHRYKYNRATWFEPLLAELLVRAAAPVLFQGGWDLIMPVPLHFVKLSERGFNQAGRLALHLSRATGIPLNTTCLKRVKYTQTQTHLDSEERAVNVRKAFAVRRRGQIEGKSIVLVDDVMTTGATLNACARVLREAGAENVCAWTLARGV